MTASNSVGSKIKAIREEKNMTREQLSENCSIDINVLKDIEEDVSIPSLSPLFKIANALGVRLGTFLDDNTEIGPTVCRKNGATKNLVTTTTLAHANSNLTYSSLASKKVGRNMEPFFVEVTPTTPDKIKVASHEGEEFMYVLEGEVHVRYGKDDYVLNAGDSIYYDSIVEHIVYSTDAPAKLIGVIYTPY